MQDMVLTASTIAYLLALFVGLVVATRGWNDLLAYFKPKVTKAQHRRTASSSRS